MTERELFYTNHGIFKLYLWEVRKNMGQYHKMYGTAWQRARKCFLREHPICAICGKPLSGQDAIVDHIIPHKGDWKLFWDTKNWQALCKHCHDSHKARQENGGLIGGCGVDGMPIDPLHPWNTQKEKE